MEERDRYGGRRPAWQSGRLYDSAVFWQREEDDDDDDEWPRAGWCWGKWGNSFAHLL